MQTSTQFETVILKGEVMCVVQVKAGSESFVDVLKNLKQETV